MNVSLGDKSLRMIDAVGVGACLVMTAVVFVVGVRPLLKREAQLQTVTTALVAERARADESSKALALLREQMAAMNQAVHQNPLRLQPLAQLNERLSLIARTATQHDVEIQRLEPGHPTPQAHYVTLPIRVGGSGGYVQLTAFLREMHRVAPDTAIAKVDLRGQPRSPGAAALFDLELVWHASP